MPELTVEHEDPIDLDGTLDSAGALQMEHSTGNLVDHEQTLTAAHSDYNDPGGLVRVKLKDFSASSQSWELTASHGANTWTRNGDHAYFDFPHSASLVEVDVLATSDATPAQTRARKIWVKTKPMDPLPDGPDAP